MEQCREGKLEEEMANKNHASIMLMLRAQITASGFKTDSIARSRE